MQCFFPLDQEDRYSSAFLAYDLGAGVGEEVSKKRNDRIKFFYPSLNTGGNYNVTTGEYTCPVNGIYFFSLTLGSSFRINARIGTGNGYLLEIDRSDGSDDEFVDHITVSSSAIYSCTIGETIFVEAAHDTTLMNY